jgi:hypothetical protein
MAMIDSLVEGAADENSRAPLGKEATRSELPERKVDRGRHRQSIRDRWTDIANVVG